MPEQIDDLKSRFPSVIPFSEIIIEDEEHTYRIIERDDGSIVPINNYVLDKAPFKSVRRVEGTYNGSPYTFVAGSDYRVIDNDGDGAKDTIDWDTAGASPDEGTSFFVTYRADSIIDRYIESFDQEFDNIDKKLDDVINSRQVDNATGKELDEIGELFGVLGKRRNRNDDEYRSYLRSIVQSFKGRGTIDGIRFAVAAGLPTDPSNIVVNEDFSNNAYSITIQSNTAHDIATIQELAELADPSGIGYQDIVTYQGIGDNVYIRASSTITTGKIVTLGSTDLGQKDLGGIA